MSFAFKSYFRKIQIVGKENIPKTGPVLMLCNHPNSFTEPMLLACFQHRILNFLVRGDVFENKFLKPILENTYQIPIYRARDGFENLRKNKSTFDLVHKKLVGQESVLIFPESTTQLVRYLRPLQKGAAHIALDSVQEHKLSNLMVIPCGVNYTQVLKAGSDVLIHFGHATSVAEWIEKNSNEPDKVAALTKYFTEEMNKVVHSVPPTSSVDLYDALSTIEMNGIQEKEIANKHNLIIESITKNAKELHQSLLDYSQNISDLEAIEFSVLNSIPKKIFFLFKSIGSFFLGIPALLLFGIPFLISKFITVSLIKKNEFKPPIRVTSSILLCLLVLIMLLILTSIKFGILIGIGLCLLSIFSIRFFLNFIYYSKQNKYLFSVFVHNNKSILLNKRQAIKDSLVL